ncbi:hypothetical protein RAG55_12340, partial [Klebsiella pneumoniae]
KRAYCLKTQPATGETYPKSDLFNKAGYSATGADTDGMVGRIRCSGYATEEQEKAISQRT